MNVFCRDQGDGILDTGADVLHCQRRIVIPNDLLEPEPLVEKLQDASHGNARACYTGLPEMHPGIDYDPVHGFAHFAHLPNNTVKPPYSTLITHIILLARTISPALCRRGSLVCSDQDPLDAPRPTPRTQEAYVAAMEHLAIHYRKSPIETILCGDSAAIPDPEGV
jgi:hypothetical protein